MTTKASGLRLAKRLDEVGFSDIVQIRNKVIELRAAGKDHCAAQRACDETCRGEHCRLAAHGLRGTPQNAVNAAHQLRLALPGAESKRKTAADDGKLREPGKADGVCLAGTGRLQDPIVTGKLPFGA